MTKIHALGLYATMLISHVFVTILEAPGKNKIRNTWIISVMQINKHVALCALAV